MSRSKLHLVVLAIFLSMLIPFSVLADTLQVSFLDVGQGDAILLQCGGKSMLVDAGTNAGSLLFIEKLKALGLARIDYLVGTHPHEDHIGGLDAVIDSFSVGTIWMPRIDHDTQTYKDVLLAIERNGYRVSSPMAGNTCTIGDATITVLGPLFDSYTEINEYSIVLRVDHGNNSFLLMGDAEIYNEMELMASDNMLSTDVLKVGHHGSSTSSSLDFLRAVSPQYAVISCGADNSYGHPTAQTLQTLATAGSTVLRTDELGDIIFTSDRTTLSHSAQTQGTTATKNLYGKTNTFSVNVRSKPSADSGKVTTLSTGSAFEIVGEEKNSKGEVWYEVLIGSSKGYIRSDLVNSISYEEFETASSAPTKAPNTSTSTSTYIGNKNTKKFHRPSCRTLPDQKNRVSLKSRDAAISAGYSPCGNCKP